MTDEIDMTDIDTQLQRCGGDHDRVLTRFQFLFDVQTSFSRQAAVVGAHLALAQALGQLVRHSLHQAPRVYEDQCRPMVFDLFNDFIVERRPNILADDRPQLLIGNLDAKL